LLVPGSVFQSRRQPGKGLLFPTVFPLTENPISQGGIWTQGGDTGLDWFNTASDGTIPEAYGTSTSIGGTIDCVSSVQGQGFSTSKFFVEIDIRIAPGYAPVEVPEVEACCFNITAHNIKGYELDCPMNGNVQPVRWNGAIGDFITTVFTTISGAVFTTTDGDRVRVEIDTTSGSPIMTYYLNGVQKWVVTDTTAGKITTALYPAMGFFCRPDASVDMKKYAITRFNCGNF
jgi:hypothetical protein